METFSTKQLFNCTTFVLISHIDDVYAISKVILSQEVTTVGFCQMSEVVRDELIKQLPQFEAPSKEFKEWRELMMSKRAEKSSKRVTAEIKVKISELIAKYALENKYTIEAMRNPPVLNVAEDYKYAKKIRLAK